MVSLSSSILFFISQLFPGKFWSAEACFAERNTPKGTATSFLLLLLLNKMLMLFTILLKMIFENFLPTSRMFHSFNIYPPDCLLFLNFSLQNAWVWPESPAFSPSPTRQDMLVCFHHFMMTFNINNHMKKTHHRIYTQYILDLTWCSYLLIMQS